VLLTSGPYANLAGTGTTDVVGAAVGVVQAVRGAGAADRISGAVDIQVVNRAFTRGLTDTLGDGPPFPVSRDDGAALLQAEIEGYGLDAPVMGKPGTLTYAVKVSILLPGGEKVYGSRTTCGVPFGDASAFSAAIGTVDNVKQLDEMSDAEIQASFEAAATQCGQTVILRMRKHAG
jgi:hypothetical protein